MSLELPLYVVLDILDCLPIGALLDHYTKVQSLRRIRRAYMLRRNAARPIDETAAIDCANCASVQSSSKQSIGIKRKRS